MHPCIRRNVAISRITSLLTSVFLLVTLIPTGGFSQECEGPEGTCSLSAGKAASSSRTEETPAPGHVAADPVVDVKTSDNIGTATDREHNIFSSAANAKTPYPRTNQMSCLPGGKFRMGADDGLGEKDGERPTREVRVRPFCMDVHEVSVAEFELFVNTTGHRSVAEEMGDSFVVDYFLSEETRSKVKESVSDRPWWLPLKGATWKTPEGIDSNIKNRRDHAVVHVAHTDAVAFCKWAGKRLPTEAEWEYACRGGLQDRSYPWGNLAKPRGEHRMNMWQGEFPRENTAEDGHAGIAPVTEYKYQNKFGLKNMIGNVWEWVSDHWGTDVKTYSTDNPTGPKTGYDRVKKGSSLLCVVGQCYQSRCSSRSSNSPDTTAYNLGFRCAADKRPDYIPHFNYKSAVAEEEKLTRTKKTKP